MIKKGILLLFSILILSGFYEIFRYNFLINYEAEKKLSFIVAMYKINDGVNPKLYEYKFSNSGMHKIDSHHLSPLWLIDGINVHESDFSFDGALIALVGHRYIKTEFSLIELGNRVTTASSFDVLAWCPISDLPEDYSVMSGVDIIYDSDNKKCKAKGKMRIKMGSE